MYVLTVSDSMPAYPCLIHVRLIAGKSMIHLFCKDIIYKV